jgi:hypothetical protein
MDEKRPPDGGKPSEINPEDDGIVHYYSREHRLSRASKNVQWLEEQRGAKRRGFFGSLVATPSLRFLLFTVLLFIVAVGIANFAMGRQDSVTLGGQIFRAKAFRFGDALYITVQRSAKTDGAFVGNAKMTVFDEKREVAAMDFIVDSSPAQEYRLTAPYPGTDGKLSLAVEAAGARGKLALPVK